MDRENRSDQEEDQQAFLSKSSSDFEGSHGDFEDGSVKGLQKKTSIWKRYLRLILEIMMAFTIVGLIFRPLVFERVKPSPVPKFPRKTYTFLPDSKYLDEDMFVSREETLHKLHNWIPLSSNGRGYVQIDDPKSFGLDEPYTISNPHAHNMEPVYMLSVYHQLHCLSYLITHFQSALNSTSTTLPEEISHHSAHCFDYIRQSLMCAADATLEGKTDAGPGWGGKHECTDYDALLNWANEKTVVKWKQNMPGEATL